jgi:hypothetical protein
LFSGLSLRDRPNVPAISPTSSVNPSSSSSSSAGSSGSRAHASSSDSCGASRASPRPLAFDGLTAHAAGQLSRQGGVLLVLERHGRVSLEDRAPAPVAATALRAL